ncbi:MAG TPA: tRNA uracil 4-sulfurtransferase ThiI [bacterium]|nr:tRNA uracil 4-sulfurtransferase ThiI [bacterium]
MTSVISLFYDEIALKGRNKKKFIKQLRYNLNGFLRAWKINVNFLTFQGSHFQIELPENVDLEFLMSKITLVPGVNHAVLSDVLDFNNDFYAAKESLMIWIEQYLQKHPLIKTFRVTSRRADKYLPVPSMEMNAQLGGWILDAYAGLRVDLHHPDWNLQIVARDKKLLIARERREGIGGLPVGTAGRVVALLSGGIDSPVAAALMMKRGAEVVLCHCQNQSINMDAVQDKIQQLAKNLMALHSRITLYILPFDYLQKAIIQSVPSDYRMIIYKRQMLRLAERLALKINAKAIITGDSLSQVASQTLDNIKTIYEAVNLPIFSPLIGLNKTEIVQLANRFGTYETSILPYGDCCSLLVSAHPHTKSKLAEVLALESNLELNTLLDDIMARAQIYQYDLNAYDEK